MKDDIIVLNTKEILENLKDKKLENEWDLWVHSLSNKNWDISGYTKLYTISKVSDFWNVFNNFNKLGPEFYHIYLMKKGITPMWEDKENRFGGICSVKIDYFQSLKIYELLCSHLVIENISKIKNDINGISFSPKLNSKLSFTIIKIWNKKATNKFTENLSKESSKILTNFNIQYKQNDPEY